MTRLMKHKNSNIPSPPTIGAKERFPCIPSNIIDVLPINFRTTTTKVLPQFVYTNKRDIGYKCSKKNIKNR